MKHTEEPYVEAINMDNRSQKLGYGHMYELFQPISWFWRTAEWDLKEQALDTNKKKCKSKLGKKIEEQENRSEEDNWTPWITVLLDFFYTTGMRVDRKNDLRKNTIKRRERCEEAGEILKRKITEEVTPMREMSMKELEFDFKAASRQMWKILQMEEMNEAIQRNSLADLNLTSSSKGRGIILEKISLVSVIQGRLKVRAPEQVNLMMHKLAIKQMDLEQGEFAIKMPMER